MSFSGKNLIKAIICLIFLSIGFTALLSNIIVGVLIASFISVSLFFDPDKMNQAKKKAERKAEKDAENLKLAADKILLEKDIDNLDLNNVEGYEVDNTK